MPRHQQLEIGELPIYCWLTYYLVNSLADTPRSRALVAGHHGSRGYATSRSPRLLAGNAGAGGDLRGLQHRGTCSLRPWERLAAAYFARSTAPTGRAPSPSPQSTELPCRPKAKPDTVLTRIKRTLAEGTIAPLRVYWEEAIHGLPTLGQLKRSLARRNGGVQPSTPLSVEGA